MPAPAAHAPLPTVELRIDGRTEGSIQYAGVVIVGPRGSIAGNIRARIILVEGEITGNLSADEAIRVTATGRVTGDLQAPRIAAARGAQIKGQMFTRRNAEQEAALDDFAVDQVLAR
jgi:cytoskeletal protein CcmA (bactofilin family)